MGAQVGTQDLVVTDHPWRGPAGFLAGASYANLVERRATPAGSEVRLRVVNTGSKPRRYWLTGTAYRLLAVDGTDVNEPAELVGRSLLLAGGGRYDLGFRMPSGPVTLHGLGQQVRIVLGEGAPSKRPKKHDDVDLASYGTAAATRFGVDSHFDRSFPLVVDQKLAFRNGRPGYQWSVNSGTYPRLPMFMVRQGELVRTTMSNRSTSTHPLHLHGHHLLVLSHNGRRITGSPWWTDSLNMSPGERYEVAFRADNPGVWMFHCHDLDHAADGFVQHLAYEGVATPYRVGGLNQPE